MKADTLRLWGKVTHGSRVHERMSDAAREFLGREEAFIMGPIVQELAS